MSDKYPIGLEVAEAQFEQLLDWYDIDEEDFEDEEQSGFRQAEKKVIRAIRQGRVEIIIEQDKDGIDTLIVYQNLGQAVKGIAENRIRYEEVCGRAKIAIREERKGPISQYAKVGQFLGGLSKLSPRVFSEMRGKDHSLAECLASIFLKV